MNLKQIFSELTFWWIFPLIRHGFKRPLTNVDVHVNIKLKEDEEPAVIVGNFSKEWEKEACASNPSLFKVVYRLCKRHFCLSGILFLMHVCTSFATPYIVYYLLQSIEEGRTDYVPIVCAIGLFAAYNLKSIFLAHANAQTVVMEYKV
jgi:hypothetical protein